MFFGLPNGTQTLTDTLAARARQAGIPIHLRSDVRSVATTADGSRYRLHVGDDADGGDRALDVDAVVLATPDFVTARLLEHLAPDVASGLASVDYASVVMVALAAPARGHRSRARRQRLPRRPAGGLGAHRLLVGVEQVGTPR